MLCTGGQKASSYHFTSLYSPSNNTGIIDRLEKKGIVQRSRKKGDRRVTLIQLTEAGDLLSRSLPNRIESRLIAGLAELP